MMPKTGFRKTGFGCAKPVFGKPVFDTHDWFSITNINNINYMNVNINVNSKSNINK